jgi:hypothetical protein
LLPSSPPQIYLNLLILEASLRSQYLTLRARRRQHTFVLVFLSIWVAYFFYGQFLRPREDGTGVGGSVYWLVDMAEKVALISGCVMGVLFWVTGQWERGVRWPSRWLRVTNRGLKDINCKIVLLKGPWWRELVSHLSFLLPIHSFVETPGSNYQYIEYPLSEKMTASLPGRQRGASKDRVEIAEEDIASSGDYIKILLLPRHFTPEFRENWEIYRAEYWEQENQRRAELRKRIRARDKAWAKQEGRWFWRIRSLGRSNPRPRALEAHGMPSHHAHSLSHSAGQKDKHRRTASVMKEKEPTHSRSSSRSSVSVGPEADERERRWSTSSTTGSISGDRRRRKIVNSIESDRRGSNPPGRARAIPSSGSRPVTPTADITLRTRASNLSSMSTGSEGDSPGRRRSAEPTIKLEPTY